MRQGRLCGCDPTSGSVLPLEFSGVPVGTQWGQIKAYWGLMGVERPSHRLRGMAQKQGCCHGPSVSSKSSKASPACHTSWPGQELSVLGTAGTRGTKPGPCRDAAGGATQGMCVSLAHAPELSLLLPRSDSLQSTRAQPGEAPPVVFG